MLPLDLLRHLGYSSNPVGDMFKSDVDRWVALRKAEENPVDNVSSHVLAALGHRREVERLSVAARFLSGRSPDLSTVSRALHRHDPDVIAGVLAAHGLKADGGGRDALSGAAKLSEPVALTEHDKPDLGKAEVSAVLPEGERFAEALKRACAAGEVKPISFKGVHSKGMMVATDPEDDHVYLVKPGSGPQSPAAGARADTASQSQREAGFWHAAKVVSLEGWLPRVDLVRLDGREVAVGEYLPSTFRTLEEIGQQDGWQRVHQILSPLRHQGVLHMWGALDFILGQTDRHWGNVMSDDKGACRLIDEGSAFAGTAFDPTYDRATYVPCYLRYSAPSDVRFSRLTPRERHRYLSLAPPTVRPHLDSWLRSIDVAAMSAVLTRYGIDPRPALGRIQMLLDLNLPLDQAVAEVWSKV